MADGFTSINLSQLPAPEVLQAVDFETALADMLAELRQRDPVFDALVESDPAYKILEIAAFYRALAIQQVNDAARAVMPAYATGADLDHIAARYAVERLLIEPGDPQALPPVAPVLESDAALRRRMFLAFEGLSTAGPMGAYVFHALGADPDVGDASVESPAPGEVLVTILSRSGNGAAPAALLAAVDTALNADDVRPLTDLVTVRGAEVLTYTIEAVLTVLPGPDSAVVREAAESAALAYASQQRRIGADITLSGLYAALHQPGVQNVALVSPVADIAVGASQAAFCIAVSVSIGGANV
ncbi:baseplate assembly protein [Phaeobacter inhibens]|uniref:baseplate assembly protein n=1 Tax=Phaeobacter inhibens TaxID=221822 RepID=UPI0001632BC6|nr:baseplate J/gp47 family protein [Phaeobacter inhibens]AFO91530.1 baseplate assembly protein J [Phaeobacter inhibens DSM 17395]AUQ46197.1 baseplate assembly protein J [Phaeobacter inhibens]